MARRGENIRKRSDGRWEGRYIKGRSADGKPCWGYVYGTTYAEVREISARKKAEYGIYNLNSEKKKDCPTHGILHYLNGGYLFLSFCWLIFVPTFREYHS